MMLVLAPVLAAACSRAVDEPPSNTGDSRTEVVVLSTLHVGRPGPRAHLEQPALVGEETASATSIAQAFLAHSVALSFCYDDRAAHDDRFVGKATFVLIIERSGAVGSVGHEDVSPDAPTFVSCVEESLRSIRFPAVEQPVTLLVPVESSAPESSESYP
jgi:hypothetical protein